MPPKKSYQERKQVNRYMKDVTGVVSSYSAGQRHRNQFVKRPFYTMAKDLAFIKGLVNSEFKAIDTTFVGQNISNLGTVYLLNGCQKGTNYDQRDGRSLKVKSLWCSSACVRNVTTGPSIVRLIWFVDKQPSGATPAVTDVLASASIYAPRNLSNKKRFFVLKEKILSVSSTGGKEKVIHKPVYKALDMHTAYDNGNAGTIADISSNAIFLLAISDQATSNYPLISFYNRIRFVDN